MNEPTFRPAAAPDTSEPANFRPVNFASDNVTGIAPEIMEAIVEANEPQGAWPYGNDEVTGELNGRFFRPVRYSGQRLSGCDRDSSQCPVPQSRRPAFQHGLLPETQPCL